MSDDDSTFTGSDRAKDVCKCGDYRHQHANGTGASRLNWDNPKGVEDCVKFRAATQVSTPALDKAHDHE